LKHRRNAEGFQLSRAIPHRQGLGDSLIQGLVRFVKQLPDYVNNTQQLTPVAKAVLQAIREARDPDQLLFADLPRACQAEPFSASGSADCSQVDGFFGALRSALTELQQAFPKLGAAIEQMLLTAFNLAGPLSHPSHECHAKFARLTKQEESHGLLTDTASIGTRAGWEARLRESGFRLKGHRLIRDAGQED
jgi:hypothetical protein